MLSHMTQESAYPCPVCRTLTTLEHPCPGCHRAPDPNAAAVIILDVRIKDLQQQVNEAKQRYDELAWQLAESRRQRESYATAVRMSVAAERSATQPTPAPVVTPPAAPVAKGAEASTGTIQNLLFILGGLLLAVAAIVFTAVAWARFGMAGRAAILGVVTLVTLAVPPLVLRRGLRATAETFAALGLLLVVLDGYAAWFVNLGGIQDSWDGSFYAGSVCAVTALAGFAYARAFRLTGPDFIALVAAQPVLPLFFAQSSASLEVWGLVFAAVALGNAAVVWLKPRPAGLVVTGWVLHGFALLTAIGIVTVAWSARGNVMSSVALMAVGLVFAAGAWVGRSFVHRFAASAFGALVLFGAVCRPLLPHFEHERQLLLAAAVAVAIVLLSQIRLPRKTAPAAEPPAVETVEDERIPALWSTFDPAREAAAAPTPPSPPPAQNPWWTGLRAGAAIVLSLPTVVVAALAMWFGLRSVVDVPPSWAWELPLTVVLLAAAGVVLTRGVAREAVVVAAVVALALVLPMPWVGDLVVAAGLLAWALWRSRMPELSAVVAVVLSGHAILTALGEPIRAMLVMTAVAGLGLAVATAAPRKGYNALGGVAAGLVDLLLPWLAFTTVAAFGGGAVAQWRVLVLTVLVVPLLGSTRGYSGYHVVSGLVIALYPLWPDLPSGEPQALYAALAAVAAALAIFRCHWKWTRAVALVPIVATMAWTFEDWARVLVQDPRPVSLPNAAALSVLLVPVVLLTWRRWLVGGLAAVLPVLIWLAYFEVPWPTIPAVTLLFGLSMVVAAARRYVAMLPFGVVLTASGLYGAREEHWSMVAALGLVVVAMAVVAVAGSARAWRIGGWLTGAAAKVWLAYEVGQLADLRPEITAYVVLLAAAILLGLSFTRFGSPIVAEAAAHGAAMVALTLAAGSARASAGVLAMWGVAVGITALRGQPVTRAWIAGILEALAWYLVLHSYEVGTLEAYTLPIAVVGVVLGILFARHLSSWAAYGPALAAALLPSLGAVLLTSGGEWRRLLLGIGALAVVVAGAVWRKQAPFVLAGSTLLVLALHELVLVWRLVQTWIPLAIIGLLLVGLAITYERRRRDLARLRETVSRMT